MDLGDSGAGELSVSLESKLRNKKAHQFFSYVSLVSCKCVSKRWKECFPVSLQFFPDITTMTFAGTDIGNIPWLPNNCFTIRERESSWQNNITV